MKTQADGIQTDLDGYKRVNREIKELQDKLTKVSGEVLDLSNRKVTVKELNTAGPGPSYLEFAAVGCRPLDKASKVGYCAKGSPPTLFQQTHEGEPRSVSSLSPTGFQDISSSPRPPCTNASRGTFYVRKRNN